MLRATTASAAGLTVTVPASLAPRLLALRERCLLEQPAKLTTALQGGLSLCSSTAGTHTARGLRRLRTTCCAAMLAQAKELDQ